ncbi:MAG: MBL fold metallo-hydrolase [Planctomycetes bacterium]|nr:MBL fold metallo-hydrolase [Planctomycetota bacterium]
MRLFLALLLSLFACSKSEIAQNGLGQPSPPTGAVGFRVLGIAQDAGLPHIGCVCTHCETARAEGHRELVASAAVEGKTGWWLLDATPDLPAQIHAQGSMPKGIFLTHAHIGHYTGLMYLGREALGAQAMPVWCSPRMASYLRSNGPWSQLVELGQIEIREFRSDVPVKLEPGLQLTAFQVPHRDEFSDTHGFLIEHFEPPAVNRSASLVFLPDIDQWEKWDYPIEKLLQADTHLLIDGTFWSGAELPHRNLDEIPHPLVSRSIERLGPTARETGAQVRFFHLNHSNPLWNRNGAEYAQLRASGLQLAVTGERVTF